MTLRDCLMIGASAAAGFIAALPTRYMTVSASETPSTVRATRFELVDSTGKVRAVWGTNRGDELVLSFVKNGTERIVMGLDTGHRPFIKLNSERGDHRASMFVYGDKPALVLSDRSLEGRIRLGPGSFDTSAADGDSDWGLTFNGTAGRGMANIGIVPVPGGHRGAINIRDPNKLVWRK